MKELNIDTKIREALNTQAKLSIESEFSLFAQAEELLTVRRDHASAKRQAKKRRVFVLQRVLSRITESLAIHSDTPATATVFLALVLALISVQKRPQSNFRMSYADLPALPKNNDFPARYDAEVLAERQEYEREVEYAHQRTSGGI